MSGTAIALQSQLDEHRRQVDVENFDITLRELVRMTEENELKRAPEYQRKFRWDATDESYLIESLLLGLPVPNVFVASNPDGSWEVVDGLQRLSTLLHFMGESESALNELGKDSRLKLTGLRKLTKFNGYTFYQLPRPLQMHFQKRSLRVTSLSDKSDPEIRFEVFERLNKGGIVLSPQEVRACISRGDFAELLRDLADNQNFNALVKLQRARQSDGTKEELILKFFAYIEWKERYDGRVKDFLNEFMREVAKQPVSTRKELFQKTMRALAAVSPCPFVRGNYPLTPLNQFEAAMVAAGEIINDGNQLVRPEGNWLEDEELIKASTGGTNTRQSFLKRTARARALLSGEV